MKFLLSVFLATAYSSVVWAANCVPKVGVGLGGEVKTYPKGFSFLLLARAANGTVVAVTTSGKGTTQDLVLAPVNTPLDALPVFVLTGGHVRTMKQPYKYITTTRSPLLGSVPLHLSPQGTGKMTSLVADNVTCDGAPEYAIRFANLTPLPLASGVIKGHYAPGTAVSSPVLNGLISMSSLHSRV